MYFSNCSELFQDDLKKAFHLVSMNETEINIIQFSNMKNVVVFSQLRGRFHFQFTSKLYNQLHKLFGQSTVGSFASGTHLMGPSKCFKKAITAYQPSPKYRDSHRWRSNTSENQRHLLLIRSHRWSF